MDIDAALQKVGRVVTGGFGDQVLIGVILGLIEGVSPGQLYAFIVNKADLMSRVSDFNWQRVRTVSSSMKLDEINLLRIQNELREDRPDLLSVIINTPGGNEWVEDQLEKAKAKLRS